MLKLEPQWEEKQGKLMKVGEDNKNDDDRTLFFFVSSIQAMIQ